MDRPVVDPHLIYTTFVHKPSQFVDPSPREHQTLTSNTVVYHFQQLYRDRSLEVMSGSCGDPIILDDRSNCFSNYCFQDLSHIQRFLMEEFNVSALQVQTMSKELSAVQERIFISQQTFVDSPALPSEGHRKRFLSVRHHLCSHRFFQNEARSRSGAHVFTYFWRGQEMEFVVLAATSRIIINSDSSSFVGGAVTLLFEALVYSSMRNQSQSNPAFYSHCTSEASRFTSLSCVVNGKASPATILDSQQRLQSVLKCSITASASKNFEVTLLSPDDSLQATLDLCALNRTTVHKVVGCTQPWMNADDLEHRYPGYHRAYLL